VVSRMMGMMVVVRWNVLLLEPPPRLEPYELAAPAPAGARLFEDGFVQPDVEWPDPCFDGFLAWDEDDEKWLPDEGRDEEEEELQLLHEEELQLVDEEDVPGFVQVTVVFLSTFPINRFLRA
jgi:hypothetical protein